MLNPAGRDALPIGNPLGVHPDTFDIQSNILSVLIVNVKEKEEVDQNFDLEVPFSLFFQENYKYYTNVTGVVTLLWHNTYV